jgi:hypothetical protein
MSKNNTVIELRVSRVRSSGCLTACGGAPRLIVIAAGSRSGSTDLIDTGPPVCRLHRDRDITSIANVEYVGTIHKITNYAYLSHVLYIRLMSRTVVRAAMYLIC